MCRLLRAREIIDIASQNWATTRDIGLIGAIGNNKALEIKKEIRAKQLERGDNLPNKQVVSMKEVLEYFNIDIQYLNSTIMKGEARW